MGDATRDAPASRAFWFGYEPSPGQLETSAKKTDMRLQ